MNIPSEEKAPIRFWQHLVALKQTSYETIGEPNMEATHTPEVWKQVMRHEFQ